MRVLGGLSLEGNRLFFSFVKNRRGKIIPCAEATKEILPTHHSHLGEFIREHIDDINKEIRKKEKHYSFKTDKIFFKLPREFAFKKIVEDEVSLSTYRYPKKITHKDIVYTKRQVENISLDWEDVCLHHLVLEYTIGNSRFYRAPIGIQAHKIKLKSSIIFIKRKFLEYFNDLFDNINYKFSGFVYDALADYSSVYSGGSDVFSLVVHIKEKETAVAGLLSAGLIFEKSFDFGEEDIVLAVANKFCISRELVRSLIVDYGSFKDVPVSKEISIREGNSYINLSSMSINSLLREVTKDIIEKIVCNIKDELDRSDFRISFIGRITRTDGFYDFIRDTLDLSLEEPTFEGDAFSAFGCACYGIRRFLEGEDKQSSMWQRILNVYKDYF